MPSWCLREGGYLARDDLQCHQVISCYDERWFLGGFCWNNKSEQFNYSEASRPIGCISNLLPGLSSKMARRHVKYRIFLECHNSSCSARAISNRLPCNLGGIDTNSAAQKTGSGTSVALHFFGIGSHCESCDLESSRSWWSSVPLWSSGQFGYWTQCYIFYWRFRGWTWLRSWNNEFHLGEGKVNLLILLQHWLTHVGRFWRTQLVPGKQENDLLSHISWRTRYMIG